MSMAHPIKKANKYDKIIFHQKDLNLNNILSHPNSKRQARGSGEEEGGGAIFVYLMFLGTPC